MEASEATQYFLCIPKTLEELYMTKLRPLEEHTKFGEFHSHLLDNSHFTSKPMILLMGHKSTGKSSILRFLLKRDFPGMKTGGETVKDGFLILEYSKVESTCPGVSLIFDPSKPYNGLSKFGNNFMNQFQGAALDNEILKHSTLIDTPGITSKQLSNEYDFVGVLSWFAERAALILIVFDASNAYISDELRQSIEAIKTNREKVGIILNKADQVNPQELKNNYGALMWSLGVIFHSQESLKVFIGSFWDNVWTSQENRKLFEMEEASFFTEIQHLPQTYSFKLLYNLIKRARLALVLSYILTTVRSQTVGIFKGTGTKKKTIEGLANIYSQISQKGDFTREDFPDLGKMQKALEKADVNELPKFKKNLTKLMNNVTAMLAVDISRLLGAMKEKEIEIETVHKITPELVPSVSPFDKSFKTIANLVEPPENKCAVDEENPEPENSDESDLLIGGATCAAMVEGQSSGVELGAKEDEKKTSTVVGNGLSSRSSNYADVESGANRSGAESRGLSPLLDYQLVDEKKFQGQKAEIVEYTKPS